MTSRRRPLEPHSVTRHEQTERNKRSRKVSKSDTLSERNEHDPYREVGMDHHKSARPAEGLCAARERAERAENTAANLRKENK